MDFFEILFVLLFVLLPVMEGVARKRRKAGKQGPGQGPGQRPGSAPESGTAAGGHPGQADHPAEAGASSASEMLPDDLWELLTGERRAGTGTAPSEVESAAEEEARSQETFEPEVAEAEVGSGAWISAPWEPEPVAPGPPVSLGYEGLEAISLEGPLQSPEARHHQFHETLDRTARTEPTPQRSGLARALRQPAGLRQAVVLREVLGPPKGLE